MGHFVSFAVYLSFGASVAFLCVACECAVSSRTRASRLVHEMEAVVFTLLALALLALSVLAAVWQYGQFWGHP